DLGRRRRPPRRTRGRRRRLRAGGRGRRAAASALGCRVARRGPERSRRCRYCHARLTRGKEGLRRTFVSLARPRGGFYIRLESDGESRLIVNTYAVLALLLPSPEALPGGVVVGGGGRAARASRGEAGRGPSDAATSGLFLASVALLGLAVVSWPLLYLLLDS